MDAAARGFASSGDYGIVVVGMTECLVTCQLADAW